MPQYRNYAEQSKQILVVDDDVALLQMVQRILSEIGEVRCSRDGLEALDLLRSGYVPDLVITDIMMPRMDGIKLCQHIKKIPQTANVPVIMLTAKGQPKDVIVGINVGARHYITKPFKTAELVAKVTKILGVK